MKTQLQVSSINHNPLCVPFNKHDKLTNNSKSWDELKMEEELVYYKVKEMYFYKL